jgi:hypothetical protein
MELLLFADENGPEWAFSKRKGVKTNFCSTFPKSGSKSGLAPTQI